MNIYRIGNVIKTTTGSIIIIIHVEDVIGFGGKVVDTKYDALSFDSENTVYIGLRHEYKQTKETCLKCNGNGHNENDDAICCACDGEGAIISVTPGLKNCIFLGHTVKEYILNSLLQNFRM